MKIIYFSIDERINEKKMTWKLYQCESNLGDRKTVDGQKNYPTKWKKLLQWISVVTTVLLSLSWETSGRIETQRHQMNGGNEHIRYWLLSDHNLCWNKKCLKYGNPYYHVKYFKSISCYLVSSCLFVFFYIYTYSCSSLSEQ